MAKVYEGWVVLAIRIKTKSQVVRASKLQPKFPQRRCLQKKSSEMSILIWIDV